MSEPRFVLDASALLCLFCDKPGAARVEAVLDRASMAAINCAEVVAKLADRGVLHDDLAVDLAELHLDICADVRQLADLAGRFCLALAQHNGATVLTRDRGWPRIGVDVEVLGRPDA